MSLKMNFSIEKSFEGGFRVVLRGDDCDIVTMPWVVGETTAMQQFTKVLHKWADVKYALQYNISIPNDFIRKVINEPIKIF